MRDFLNDFIDTLPDRTRVKASVMMRRAALERKEVGALIKKVTTDLSLGDVRFPEVSLLGRIDASELLLSYRELLLRTDMFYRLSRDITDILDSETITMMSEIKELEQELESIEKSIANYSFLLSDGNSYDYAYMEPFSDEINRAVDLDFLIPDRAGLTFSPDQQAAVNRSQGRLVLASHTQNTTPFIAEVGENNYAGFVTSDTGVSNIAQSEVGTGWKVSISSPAPLTGTIPSFVGLHGVSTYSGAQAVVNLQMAAPAPCDFITVAPLSDSSVDIAQITTYSDDQGSDPIDLLQAALSIEKPVGIFFEPRSISAVKILIRQRTYRRDNREPQDSETIYKRVFKNHRSRVSFGGRRQKNKIRSISGLSQIFVKNYTRRARGLEPLSVRVSNKRLGLHRWGPLDARMNISRNSENITARPDWFAGNESEVIVKAAYDTKQMGDQLKKGIFTKRNDDTRRVNPAYEYLSEGTFGDRMSSRSTYGDGRPNLETGRIRSISSVENKIATSYKYNLGLNYITLGIQSQIEKGVFVSKSIPSSGDVIQVKIKESHTDAIINNDATLDTKLASSVEYSVSNVARPASESDWVPIQPVNSSVVRGELLMLDDKGKAFLRFPAKKNEGITVYKNNFIFPFDGSDIVHSQGDTTIVGVIFDTAMFTPTDMFTVDYVPSGDPSLVDFSKRGYVETPLVSSFDEDGAGEGFDSTDGQLSIQLSNHPFIDYAQVTTSTYNSTTGMTPYQPLTPVFDDGTVAINLTNYKSGAEASLNAASASYQFIHRGKTLLFNKEIASPFRVYYNHLPNNIRVRTVLRSNIQGGLVSPSVDYVQLKAKTRAANAKEIS